MFGFVIRLHAPKLVFSGQFSRYHLAIIISLHFQIYKVVLTGGPCGGKTTGMDRIFSFFDNLGWRVFTVPEAATILLGTKIKFGDLSPEAAYMFQKDILKTMLQIEQVRK